jgi:uncharacterized phage protein gp47/JayE
MPWSSPTLKQVRGLVRDSINGALPGADASVPNSVLRVLSDCQGALCHLVLQYIDWLALQLLPDTAETEWLDRHGAIWLVNADGSIGRKGATLASGTATFTGTIGAILPAASQISGGYITTADITMGSGPVNGPVTATVPGTVGNLDPGTSLNLVSPPPGIDSPLTVVEMDGGTETETDDELRARILQRIQNPPMGGDADDYVAWSLSYPGVTRAWSYPQEMGIGTMTLRFLMDDLRSGNSGWPEPQDVLNVQDYIDTVRPVTVKDFWVEAPLKQYVDVTIGRLVPNTDEAKAEIETSLQQMLLVRAAPGQTIFAAWKSYAVMNAPSIVSFDLVNNADDVMQAPGYMAVLRDIIYE